MSCNVSTPPATPLVRAIQYDIWKAGEQDFRRTGATHVMRQKTLSGTWIYTIEQIDGSLHYVTRYNDVKKTAIPFSPTPKNL
jgi:hypothetical protein